MADFNLAIPEVLIHEGGYSSGGSDPGGETNFGISKRSYPDVDIKNLTVDQAKEIYRRDFWKFDGIKDQAVATKIFDSFVNMGHWAILLSQRAVGLIDDGYYGPRTEAAINSMSSTYFLATYRTELVGYYNNLVQEHPALGKFLNGWLKRANS